MAVEIEAHVQQLPDRARSQTVAAGLFPRVRLLLRHDNGQAAARQPVSGGGTARSATNNKDIGINHETTRLVGAAPSGNA